jgi:hypothetical protein
MIDFSGDVLYDRVRYAGMAELADAQDLGSCEEIRMGSTPITRTTKNRKQTSMYVRLLSVF